MSEKTPSSAQYFAQLRSKTGISREAFSRLVQAPIGAIRKIEAGNADLPTNIGFYEKLVALGHIPPEIVRGLLFTDRAPSWFRLDDPVADNLATIEFGTMFNYYRQRSGLILQGVADELAVSPSLISKIDLGRTPPPQNNHRFYDLLSSCLKLQEYERAEMLLVTQPPRWLFPDRYNALEAALSQTVVAERRNGLKVEISFYRGKKNEEYHGLLSEIMYSSAELLLMGKVSAEDVMKVALSIKLSYPYIRLTEPTSK